MRAITATEMRNSEKIAIEKFGIPSLLLMENAASGFVSALETETGSVSGRNIHIFCGKGNNGGDGFAIARLLKIRGARVFITPLFDEKDLKGDALLNFNLLKEFDIPFVSKDEPPQTDIIIDAIFGTGFSGEITGEAYFAAEYINNSKAFVVSVDVPSGVNADTGFCAKGAVFCDLCITFGEIKSGLLFFPAKNYYKKLVLTKISVPEKAIKSESAEYVVINEDLKKLLPERNLDSHKGSFGKVLAHVGSKGFSGAAVLSLSSAIKSGCGMVHAVVCEDILDSVSSKVISATFTSVPAKDGEPSKSVSKVILDNLDGRDCLLIGCGIGRYKNTADAVLNIIKKCEKPMVIDADGLFAISENPDVLLGKKAPVVLTPHLAEFSRLSGLSVSQIKEDPIRAAKSFSEHYGVTLVLKDAVSVISDESGKVYINTCANSGLATAGSGDVLAGIIASLIAQGISATDAATLGSYLHSVAGLLAKNDLGERSLIAEDLLNYLPLAFTEEINLLPNIKEL
ncbi:MAG: NAD(P)H-hydrate dehydratase [Clostridia bacterium]|nr:NAD(P)H-hydrate dehydratase [Clostridia bacterium]